MHVNRLTVWMIYRTIPDGFGPGNMVVLDFMSVNVYSGCRMMFYCMRFSFYVINSLVLNIGISFFSFVVVITGTRVSSLFVCFTAYRGSGSCSGSFPVNRGSVFCRFPVSTCPVSC